MNLLGTVIGHHPLILNATSVKKCVQSTLLAPSVSHLESWEEKTDTWCVAERALGTVRIVDKNLKVMQFG